MSKRQIQWAATHDWFQQPTVDGRGVIVIDRTYHLNGLVTVQYLEFYDFNLLRDFAGY